MRFAVLYIPDFPVWALQYFEPALRACELLVQLAGKVVARSDALRRAGVELGWPLERAQAHAAGAMVRPHPGTLVRVAWEVVLRELNALTPWLASGIQLTGGRNEMVVPVPGFATMQFFRDGDAQTAAVRLHARVGVADDRATALLAALRAVPGQARIVPVGEGAAFRETAPLTLLEELGVSVETLQRLKWLGFQTVGSLQKLTAPQLAAQFAEGETLHALAQGLGFRAVQLFFPPPLVSVQYQAPDALHEPCDYEPVLEHLLRRLSVMLGERQAQLVTVHLETNRGPCTARRISHAPTAEVRELSTLARLAWREALAGGTQRTPPDQAEPLQERAELAPPSLEVEAVTVSLGGLVRSSPQQQVLWQERDEVQEAVRGVELRWPGALRRVVHHADAYLPEEAYHLVSASTSLLRPKKKSPQSLRLTPRLADASRRGQTPVRKTKRSTAGTVRHDGSVASGTFAMVAAESDDLR